MGRSLLLVLLFAVTHPALAKPHREKPPVPCSHLWPAVTETLANPGNYKVVGMNQEEFKANFIVVGALFPATHLVQLKPREGGCDLKIRMGFTGADDEGAFRNRVSRALKKLNAAKAAAPPETGQAQ
jgi:hypothetical protein